MTDVAASEIRKLLARAVGPAPWYWQSFPALTSNSRQRFVWQHHGDQGPLAYLVTLHLEQEPDKPRLALNTYCRPFFVPPANLGVWCPEGRNLRLTCFDPDTLKPFELGELAGWFKQSSERIYAGTAPVAELEVPLALPSGAHKIDVPAEFSAVEELIAPLAAAKRIQYSLRLDCKSGRVCADSEKLRQILINLLSNAIRYTEPDGQVIVSCAADDQHVLINVRDTGVGIPADKLEAIFEPFVQVSRAYAGQRQGTGLGLSISRDLAQGMGGELTVRSEIGKGSVFTVRLRKA